MISVVRGAAPTVVGRFASAVEAARAVDVLLDAGIPSACIDARTDAAVALEVRGRSDRYFAIETLRELGARVQVVEPLTPA